MADDRIIVAIERIEKGLARLERVTAEARPAPAPDAAYEALTQRHATLRAETESAVAALDTLIAALEPADSHG